MMTSSTENYRDDCGNVRGGVQMAMKWGSSMDKYGCIMNNDISPSSSPPLLVQQQSYHHQMLKDKSSPQSESDCIGGVEGLSAEEQARRYRTNYTRTQIARLEDEFRREKYLSRPRRCELANELGLKETTIKVWFQNRRMKEKRQLASLALPVFANADPNLYAFLVESATAYMNYTSMTGNLPPSSTKQTPLPAHHPSFLQSNSNLMQHSATLNSLDLNSPVSPNTSAENPQHTSTVKHSPSNCNQTVSSERVSPKALPQSSSNSISHSDIFSRSTTTSSPGNVYPIPHQQHGMFVPSSVPGVPIFPSMAPPGLSPNNSATAVYEANIRLAMEHFAATGNPHFNDHLAAVANNFGSSPHNPYVHHPMGGGSTTFPGRLYHPGMPTAPIATNPYTFLPAGLSPMHRLFQAPGSHPLGLLKSPNAVPPPFQFPLTSNSAPHLHNYGNQSPTSSTSSPTSPLQLSAKIEDTSPESTSATSLQNTSIQSSSRTKLFRPFILADEN